MMREIHALQSEYWAAQARANKLRAELRRAEQDSDQALGGSNDR